MVGEASEREAGEEREKETKTGATSMIGGVIIICNFRVAHKC